MGWPTFWKKALTWRGSETTEILELGAGEVRAMRKYEDILVIGFLLHCPLSWGGMDWG